MKSPAITILSKKDLSAVRTMLQKRRLQGESVQQQVATIVDKVRQKGDQALIDCAQTYDQVNLTSQELICDLTALDLDKLKSQIDPDVLNALEMAYHNISDFHQNHRKTSKKRFYRYGVFLGSLQKPFKRVGVYVPGGSAPLISSILMTAIPAQVAGVSEIVMATPPQKNQDQPYHVHPAMLYAARMCGVTQLLCAGGAQAIAALAYGTEHIERVDKIVGPGNAYVTEAKQQLKGSVGIDMAAGPSEILVVADVKANPRWVAADLMSQAEHDPLAAAYLVAFHEEWVQQVVKEFHNLLQDMPRRSIIEHSWQNNSGLFVVQNIAQAADVVNLVAPEHLEIMLREPQLILDQIQHAGAIFIGDYTPEAMGDYIAGPSHVLPTSGAARFSSGLSTEDFYVTSNVIQYLPQAFQHEAQSAIALARLEGLEAHAQSIELRLS